MEFLFLGTSSGIPTKTRNVSGLAIRLSASKKWYLVDCGEGTQHRLLHTGLSLANLDAVFITHIHGDHCYGLPGLLASAGMQSRTDRMIIAGPPAVKRYLECVLETTQVRLPYALEYINIEEMPAMSFLSDFQVQATPLSHRVPSYAYSFSEKTVEGKLNLTKLKEDGIPTGPIWSQIQQGRDMVLPDGRLLHAEDYLLPRRKPRKIIVCGDNDTPELLATEAETADVLIHEATYTQAVLDKVGPAPQHSSAEQVARFAEHAHIENLVLTHFSPRYHGHKEGEPSLHDIETEARIVYRSNLFLANDLDRYFLDKQRVLSKAM